jgi:hypothetical protein
MLNAKHSLGADLQAKVPRLLSLADELDKKYASIQRSAPQQKGNTDGNELEKESTL